MNKKKYLKVLNDIYSFQFNFKVKKLPLGQIKYHKKNFSKFFNLKIKDFKHKEILDTGAGSGQHSATLALMGAHVFATDVLQSNIEKIKKTRKIYKFKNFEIFRHDYTQKLKSKKKFKFISCHNWIQHTPNPSKTLFNITQNLEKGGKIYISCYHANTFRFFITQIVRKILDSSHFELLKKRVFKKFRKGFSIYRNPDKIFLTNITDDFFSPYIVTTTYSEMLKLSKKLKLKAYTKIPKIKNIESLDDIPLKVGFKKTGEIKKFMGCKYFTKSIDELKNHKNEILKKTSQKSKKIIKLFKNKDANKKIDFCLGLYKIRAKTSHFKSLKKYNLLVKYLDKHLVV